MSWESPSNSDRNKTSPRSRSEARAATSAPTAWARSSRVATSPSVHARGRASHTLSDPMAAPPGARTGTPR